MDMGFSKTNPAYGVLLDYVLEFIANSLKLITLNFIAPIYIYIYIEKGLNKNYVLILLHRCISCIIINRKYSGFKLMNYFRHITLERFSNAQRSPHFFYHTLKHRIPYSEAHPNRFNSMNNHEVRINPTLHSIYTKEHQTYCRIVIGCNQNYRQLKS